MDALSRMLEVLDPALREELATEVRRRLFTSQSLDGDKRWVLAGHRSAGKTSLLPVFAELSGRVAIDLDQEIERSAGRSVRALFADSPTRFRKLEREAFERTPKDAVIAVGGGFLFHHHDLLRSEEAILVPITFETYQARLLEDRSRPRLRPELSVDEELRQTFEEREALHRSVPTLPLAEAVATLLRRHLRVVTLPPGVAAIAFSRRARRAGADLLEVRTDLHPDALDLREVELPLLVSQRDRPPPRAWTEAAALLDVPVEQGANEETNVLWSHHAPSPMTPDQAVALWQTRERGARIKHVEPLGELSDAQRLLETQARLIAGFGEGNVTVLATGAVALPFRCVLARRNALDYLALDSSFAAAPGQRLLADAVREGARPRRGPRLGILGSAIAHSRSPRIHRQPFDRLDLPPDAPIAELLRALHPHYRGFAVTSPFKRGAAAAVGGTQEAINTLVRKADGWDATNTDVDGARAVLEALPEGPVTVLGQGGVAPALRKAAHESGRELRFVHAGDPVTAPLQGNVIWTWPADVAPPARLRFDGATVAVIAYGPGARLIAQEITRRGGTPRKLGPRWLIAQARVQRSLWDAARLPPGATREDPSATDP